MLQMTPCQFRPRRNTGSLLLSSLLLFAALVTPQMAKAQDTWTQQNPTTSPTARYGHNMAWDGHEVILFGGLINGGGSIVNDTWAWDGSQWTLLSPAHKPPVRDLEGMVYDAARSKIVLFGGTGSGTLGDTWTWDGTDWTNVTPSPLTAANSPSARLRPRMGYDPVSQLVLLYGG